jgi:hypothetical protein
MTSEQRTFRTIFDSKRFIIKSDDTMLKTRPFNDISEALLHRKLMMELKQSVYSDKYSVFTVNPSNNSIHETVKYFLRMISQIYSYNVPVTIKYSLAEILNKIDKSIKIEFVLNLLAAYESDKGNVVTKLPIYRKSSDFVLELYNELSILAEKSELYINILDTFLVYFNNFSCLPKSPEELKNDLIIKLTKIDPRRLVIIQNKEEINIKILKE